MKQKIFNIIHSITMPVFLTILFLMLPVVFLSCYINWSYMRSGMEQVEQAHVQLLESYMSQIDRELDLAENYVNSMTFYSSSTVYLLDRNSSHFYYSANSLNTEIAKTALYYQYITGFYFYIPESEFQYVYLRDTSQPEGQEVMAGYITGTFAALSLESSEWQYVEIDGSPYLMQGYCSNGIYGGSFVALNALPEIEDAEVFFVDAEQVDALETDKGEQLLTVQSDKCTLTVCERLNQQEALSTLPFFQRYFRFVTLFMVLMLPLVYLVLRRLIILPLRRLTAAMERLEQSDFDALITHGSRTTEFAQIEHTFNHMAGKIQGLKIEVYEKQLENQQTRLKNLSYQLRPHFMINSLNMAYNMILSQEYDTAAKLMRFSASYMRYLLKTEDDFVPLQAELAHIQDYINIQQLRYEGQFTYETAVDPFVEDILIPNMVLQNFIENSVKYSIGPDHKTLIQLTVDYDERDGVPCAVITVRDNGGGYPAWLLEALEKHDYDALRERVGLQNTMLRIQMLYGDRAECRFYNDNGAVSRFRFPLDTEE
ncbi:MAG: histidine kinase [Clostridiales bacterium]|nr:histidine kinase [Clostridiales bacterium]